jgi:hypothetical protein
MIDSSLNKFYFLSGSLTSGSYVELDGINNLSISASQSYDKSFTLGGQLQPSALTAQTQIDVSFDRSFVQKDYLLSFTGANALPAASIYNGQYYYDVGNLYLMNYSAAFAVGDLPKINTKFTSFDGEIKQTDTLRGLTGVSGFTEFQKSQVSLDIPKLNSIFVTGSNAATLSLLKNNAQIFGFDYNLAVSRTPYFTIGSKYPTEVCPILPLDISLTVSSKLALSSSSDVLHPSIFQSDFFEFDIVVSGSSGLVYFPIRKARFASHAVETQGKNTVEVKRTFIGSYGL